MRKKVFALSICVFKFTVSKNKNVYAQTYFCRQMKYLLMLPDDVFRQQMLPYLTVHDVGVLEYACVKHEYRLQLLEKISGVILIGDKDKLMSLSLFEWLYTRRVYLTNLYVEESLVAGLLDSGVNIDEDQFKYLLHLHVRQYSRHYSAMQLVETSIAFLIPHCKGLLSLFLENCAIRDELFISIAPHFTRLQSLKIVWCYNLTDDSITSIAQYCTGLHSLSLKGCGNVTDASIISMAQQCATRLQSLNLEWCYNSTDVGIISVAQHCTRLQSLNVKGCSCIKDDGVIAIAQHCTGLLRLNLDGNISVTDAGIIAIAQHCTGLQSLNAEGCPKISDACITFIAQRCTELKSLKHTRVR